MATSTGIAPATLEQVVDALAPLDQWAKRCHEASLFVVRSGIFGESRVARGFCKGVGSQHSWVVLGLDCYADHVTIVDPTLWSYDDDVEGVWTGPGGRHTPHGTGNIFEWGRPPRATDEPVELQPQQPFSDSARLFLDLLGPIDEKGWRILCSAPVEGWPAAEIFGAILETFEWGAAVLPIDIVGMVTDRNPNGLYLPGEEKG